MKYIRLGPASTGCFIITYSISVSQTKERPARIACYSMASHPTGQFHPGEAQIWFQRAGKEISIFFSSQGTKQQGVVVYVMLISKLFSRKVW